MSALPLYLNVLVLHFAMNSNARDFWNAAFEYCLDFM